MSEMGSGRQMGKQIRSISKSKKKFDCEKWHSFLRPIVYFLKSPPSSAGLSPHASLNITNTLLDLTFFRYLSILSQATRYSTPPETKRSMFP
ncbi:hypothetical protein HanRHA438_Chr16g0743611 [Helianthus annuus]|nr:hypothetical protein HanRHA438_Chr16g0743611 [Helianthus annuus]